MLKGSYRNSNARKVVEDTPEFASEPISEDDTVKKPIFLPFSVVEATSNTTHEKSEQSVGDEKAANKQKKKKGKLPDFS
jgi:hypothetical protein